jgi:hypothetical protein
MILGRGLDCFPWPWTTLGSLALGGCARWGAGLASWAASRHPSSSSSSTLLPMAEYKGSAAINAKLAAGAEASDTARSATGGASGGGSPVHTPRDISTTERHPA